jgi:8-oxo-dGTP pyrophosphatase MutT (NUDIX family)
MLKELLNLQGEDIFKAAEREVKEETGVSVEYIYFNKCCSYLLIYLLV